ncbi:MAG: hypothetical protein V4489_06945 [Chlamydiota bacterium]
MNTLDSLHRTSREATNSTSPDDTGLIKKNLIKAQEVEFYIRKQIYKESARDRLPLFEGFFTGIGNAFTNPLGLLEPKKTLTIISHRLAKEQEYNQHRPGIKFKRFESVSCVFCNIVNGNTAKHQILEEQQNQGLRVESLRKEIKHQSIGFTSPIVANELDRLTLSLAESILKNMIPVRQHLRAVMDHEKVSKNCESVVNNRSSLLKGKSKEVYENVLLKTKEEATIELKNEYRLGICAVAAVAIGVFNFKSY